MILSVLSISILTEFFASTVQRSTIVPGGLSYRCQIFLLFVAFLKGCSCCRELPISCISFVKSWKPLVVRCSGSPHPAGPAAELSKKERRVFFRTCAVDGLFVVAEEKSTSRHRGWYYGRSFSSTLVSLMCLCSVCAKNNHNHTDSLTESTASADSLFLSRLMLPSDGHPPRLALGF